MSIYIEQTAMAAFHSLGSYTASVKERPAILLINGLIFTSDIPANAGDAQSINSTMSALVAKSSK